MGLGGFIARAVLVRAASRATRRFTGGTISKPSKAHALIRLPQLLPLTLALLRDSRVPKWQKGTVLGLVGLIISPIDLPGNVPLLGQLWDFTLAVVVLETFIQVAPRDVVAEHVERLGLENKIKFRER